MLDSKNPQMVIARTEYPILEPIKDYEKSSVGTIVFPCGAVEMGEYIYIYYGGGDSNTSIAKINKQEIITYLTNQTNKKYLRI